MQSCRPILFTGAFAAALVAAAAGAAQEPPPRESSLVVYGDDPCPRSSEEEIVVCARRPEEERYRIPSQLRERTDRPAEISWGSRSEDLEQAQRDSRPNSCSVVGAAGQSGCRQEMLRQWYGERRFRRRQ